MLNRQNLYRHFRRNSRGFTLIEVLVALALLGILAVAFLGALSTASKAIIVADEQVNAESLARSQMEYVKNQDYITALDYDSLVPGSGEVTYLKISDIPEGYTIWSVNRDNEIVNGGDDDPIIAVPWNSDLLTNAPTDEYDEGLQRIKLIIKHYDEEVLTLEDYKVDR